MSEFFKLGFYKFQEMFIPYIFYKYHNFKNSINYFYKFRKKLYKAPIYSISSY